MGGGGPLSCCCASVFILGVVLFACSFDTLEPYEIGIKYNSVSLTVDEEHGAYSNGRYFLGLGTSFVKYPSNLIFAQFEGPTSLRAWSQEGQLIIVDLGFFYRLNRDRLVDIYKRYDQEYEQRVIQISTRAIKQITVQYNATNFFEDRTMIGNHMARELRKRMGEEDITMELFALRAVDIPDVFEQKVVQKVVKLQEKKTAVHQKETALERAEIVVKRGEGDALVNENIAKASNEVTRLVEGAKARGFEMVTTQAAASFQAMKTALGLNSTNLLKYRWAQLMEKRADKALSVNIGFDKAAITVGA